MDSLGEPIGDFFLLAGDKPTEKPQNPSQPLSTQLTNGINTNGINDDDDDVIVEISSPTSKKVKTMNQANSMVEDDDVIEIL
jgi:hypothetical protein